MHRGLRGRLPHPNRSRAARCCIALFVVGAVYDRPRFFICDWWAVIDRPYNIEDEQCSRAGRPYFGWGAGAGLANRDASIAAFACTLLSCEVACPLVQVSIHLCGIFTPATSR